MFDVALSPLNQHVLKSSQTKIYRENLKISSENKTQTLSGWNINCNMTIIAVLFSYFIIRCVQVSIPIWIATAQLVIITLRIWKISFWVLSDGAYYLREFSQTIRDNTFYNLLLWFAKNNSLISKCTMLLEKYAWYMQLIANLCKCN